MKKQKPSSTAIRCVADNPGQTIDLYENGRVRLHANGWTLEYQPTTAEYATISHLIFDLNNIGAGLLGQPCKVCKRKK